MIKRFFSIPMDPADLHKSEASGEIAMQETSDYEGVNLTDNFGGGNFDVCHADGQPDTLRKRYSLK